MMTVLLIILLNVDHYFLLAKDLVDSLIFYQRD